MRSGMIHFTAPLPLGLIAYIPNCATVLIRSPSGFTEFASSFRKMWVGEIDDYNPVVANKEEIGKKLGYGKLERLGNLEDREEEKRAHTHC
jgi:hypothetical protein